MRKIVLNIFSAFALLFLLFIIPSCSSTSSDDLVGNWVNQYSFEGKARSNAITFTINDIAYVVSGYDNDEGVRLKDTWAFYPDKNQWIQKADFPGDGRTGGVGFSANGKGYVCTGRNNTTNLSDTWEYDPTADSWTKKADFGGGARYGATAFSVGNKGYVVGGYDGNFLKDLWEYDPATDSWVKKTSPSGSKRAYASSFVINNIAYVVGGNNNGTYVEDFWAYDASLDTWTKKRDISNNSDDSYDNDYTSITRQDAATFVINGRAYLATGFKSGLVSKVWEYDPATDLWEQKTSFEGSARDNAVGITVQNRGFVLSGKSGSQYFDDIWEFEPFADYNYKD